MNRGITEAVMRYMNEFYFESAAMILALITVGKMLEARSKGKTTDALKKPYEAGTEDGCRDPGWGMRQRYRWRQVQIGDVFVVQPGRKYSGGRCRAGGKQCGQ